jgi:hypothetical protein
VAIERTIEWSVGTVGAVERAVRAVQGSARRTVDGTAERAIELTREWAMERPTEWTPKRTVETMERRRHRTVPMCGWLLSIARTSAGNDTRRRGGDEAAINTHVGGAAAKVVQLVKLEGWDAKVGGWCVAHLRKTSIVGRVAPCKTRWRRHCHVCHGIWVVEEVWRHLGTADCDFLFVQPAMRLHQPWGRSVRRGSLSRTRHVRRKAIHSLWQVSERIHVCIVGSSPLALSVHEVEEEFVVAVDISVGRCGVVHRRKGVAGHWLVVQAVAHHLHVESIRLSQCLEMLLTLLVEDALVYPGMAFGDVAGISLLVH